MLTSSARVVVSPTTQDPKTGHFVYKQLFAAIPGTLFCFLFFLFSFRLLELVTARGLRNPDTYSRTILLLPHQIRAPRTTTGTTSRRRRSFLRPRRQRIKKATSNSSNRIGGGSGTDKRRSWRSWSCYVSLFMVVCR